MESSDVTAHNADRPEPDVELTAASKDPIIPPKWLLLASAKGGSGKTTTALNLAVFAAHAGMRVLLLDLDTQRTLSRWHARRPTQAPALQLRSADLRNASQVLADIEATADVHLVVIDTPPGIDDHPKETRMLVYKADFVLIPTSQGTPDVDSVVEWMSFVRRERRRAAFVLNRTQRSFTSFRDAKSRLVKAGSLCPIDVRQLEDIQATHRHGVGVIEIRKAKGAEDMEGVWDFVRHELELSV